MKEIIRLEDCREQMIKNFTTGQEKGTTTYFKEFDNCWTWRRGESNIWSGYSNEGKSIYLKQLCLIKWLSEGKKFVFCSPEDAPAESFFDDLIHTLSGKSTDLGRMNHISEEEYLRCMDRIKDGFIFISLEYPNNTIPNVLEKVKVLIEGGEDIFGVIIDPILKFSRPKDAPERDDLYGGYITMIITDFCRKYNISTHLVMHQVTPKLDSEGYYQKPNLYAIKLGGSFADGIDNVLFVWRPKYSKDKLDTSVTVGSLKIKKQKLTGIPQDLDILFDRMSNRYIYGNNKPVFDFDKYKLK